MKILRSGPVKQAILEDVEPHKVDMQKSRQLLQGEVDVAKVHIIINELSLCNSNS